MDIASQLGGQVIHHPVVGGGGGGQDGDVLGQAQDHVPQPAVVQAEIVAPVGDAVGLVNDKQADADLGQTGLDVLPEQGLGGDQHQVQGPGGHTVQNLRPPVRRCAVQGVAAQAQMSGGLDLVLHQGQERADHNGEAPPLISQQLGAGEVDQALSPARPLHHQGPAVEHGRLDGLVLSGSEFCALPVQGAQDCHRLLVDRLIVNFHTNILLILSLFRQGSQTLISL